MIKTKSLRQAMQERTLVRIARLFEPGMARGYVLDVGPKFFLFALLTDRLWFDGFTCFRIGDVLEVEPDPNATFYELALKKRGERLPEKPNIDLKNAATILASAGDAFPLVGVCREGVQPFTCWTGRVTALDEKFASLLEIDLDATWESKPARHRLSQITGIRFGGDYEEALHLVGGPPDWESAE